MGMDCKAGTKLEEVMGATCVHNIIAFFTFSGRLNDYWGTYQAIIDKCDQVITEKEDNAVWDTYVYSRQALYRLQELDEEVKFGDDLTNFIMELLNSPHDTFYIQIY